VPLLEVRVALPPFTVIESFWLPTIPPLPLAAMLSEPALCILPLLSGAGDAGSAGFGPGLSNPA
jgi:hypothetical protein